MKTRNSKECVELFVSCLLQTDVIGTTGFHIAEIEKDFLRAGRASKFSHNLDSKRTFTILKREAGSRGATHMS